MTEEQEKIIDVALWSWVILSPHERRDKYKDLMRVIRTVAAESRIEGIEEGWNMATTSFQLIERELTNALAGAMGRAETILRKKVGLFKEQKG